MHQDVWEVSNAEGYQIIDNDVYINEHTYHQSVFAQTGVETRYPNPQSMEDFLSDWSEVQFARLAAHGRDDGPHLRPRRLRPSDLAAAVRPPDRERHKKNSGPGIDCILGPLVVIFA